MNILRVIIEGISYKRPGLNKVKFIAIYETYQRRGVIIYDTLNNKWLTHNKDIELLVIICQKLSQNMKKYK